MKKFLIFLLMVLMVGVVYGDTPQLDVCQENINDNETCRMVSPYIVCSSYTYDIYDKNGTTLIETGNLTFITEGFYYFNFTEPKGYYLVRLCDDTTRIAYVQKSEVSLMAIELSIMAGIIAMICIFLFIAFKIDEEHWALKFLFVAISVYMIALIPRALYYFEPYPIVGDMVKYSTRITYIFSVYIFLYFIWKMLDYYDKLVPIKRYFSERFRNRKKE